MHFFIHRSRDDSSAADAGSSLPAPDEASRDYKTLDPAALRFRHEDGRLQMRQGEEEWQEIRLALLFPLSEPEKWVSVLDKEGRELGILLELHALSKTDQTCVREELHRRYLVPKIRRVCACRDRFDLGEWEVETDRGQATFLTRNLREQAKQPLPRHLSLTDVEGNRYDIPDVTALDSQSQRLLEERL